MCWNTEVETAFKTNSRSYGVEKEDLKEHGYNGKVEAFAQNYVIWKLVIEANFGTERIS